MRHLRTFSRASSGATAVEFSLVLAPLTMLLAMILQFALFAFQHERLASVVYDLSSHRQAELVLQPRDEVRRILCRELPLVEQCNGDAVKLELAPVETARASATVDPQLYVTGSPGTLLLLRVEVRLTSLFPGLGDIPVRSTAVFVRI